MAKLKDIQISHEIEKEKNQDHQLLVKFSSEKSERPKEGYRIYKLVNMKKGRVYIDGIDDYAKNPNNKNKQERIYLLNGASSIWSSELSELLKDKDYLRQNRRSLTFENGTLRVPEWDEITISFIENCSHFIESPNKRSGSKFEFFEYNPQKMEEARLKREELEIDMAIEAKQMEITKARKLSMFLGLPMYDEMGLPISESGIRSSLMRYARNNPEKFKENIDNKQVEVSYLIKRGIMDAKLDLHGDGGVIKWANGGFICKLPSSRKHHDYLLELALSNTEEGQTFLEQLKENIK
jgi:hypothetical protein